MTLEKHPETSKRPETIAARTGIEADTQHGAVVPPLYLSTNFTFAGFDQKRQYDYTRSGNPTRDLLAEALSDLEGGEGAVVTATGMAAITLVLQLLSPEDCLLAPHDCYGGTYRLLDSLAEKGLFKAKFIDFHDEAQLHQGLALRPKILWIETPSNPLLRLTDIERVCRLCQHAGVISVVDNTFLSPLLQKPLALGADIVVHSTTKYINGHSDVVGGAVIAKNAELLEQLQWWANCLGLSGSPFDAFLTLRGLRSIHSRLRSHQENAQQVAEFLEQHPAVKRVIYPGLPSHPDHELAKKQQSGFGAMLSFELVAGRLGLTTFLENLNCFSLAESLGGVESLIAHPATMTHAGMSEEARLKAGISDQLLRLSVGIEAGDDLVADLTYALASIPKQRQSA